MKKVLTGMAAIGFTLISAVIFIVLSILFFFLNVWIIKVGAGWAGFTALDGNWVVLSAAFLTAASVISSALSK